MAVAKFATNNLVKEHDEYVKFMENREAELRKSNATSPILFYKRRLLNGAPTNQNNSLYRAINKWHCIMISYKIWYRLAKPYVCFTPSTNCKQMVDVPSNILNEFKTQTEKAIKAADCDVNTKSTHVNSKYNACRYLAMYWTYLDIIKDTETQRFIPNKDTIERAAEIFGYKPDENPFKMNGAYWNWNKETEEQPMEEKTVACDDILNTPIRDLNFTIRTFNCLYRSKILTLGDICMKSQRQLLKVRNLGRHSLNEIKDKLAEYDYYYMDLDSNAQKAHPKEESVVDICEQVAETLGIVSPSKVHSDMSEYPTYKDIATISQIDGYKSENKELRELIKKLEDEKRDIQQELLKAKDHVASLESTIRKLTMAQAAEDDDIFGLITNIVRMMKVKKMDWLYLTLDGMTIDIHKKADVEGSPRMSYTIRTREE